MNAAVPALSTRGVTTCRGCESSVLETVLDLGSQPLANELLAEPDAPDDAFPLLLRICARCGLGQVGEFVLPDRIFGNYPYLSSVSSSWVAHASAYATAMRDEMALTEDALVVEIASNDGYLLQEFSALGIRVLGVEPARNVAALAWAAGVPTISEFFGKKVAERIADEYGRPRLIVANNVMAHVPDLDDFVAGLAALSADNTVITIENPSFLNLLLRTQFDTIYHEHFSYLSAHSVARIVARHGLQLVRVQELTTHGGSYRYWIVPEGRRRVEPSVKNTIERERADGLLVPSVWTDFARRTSAIIEGARRWLEDCTERGARVAAYGAAAKGNTLLNAARVTATDIAVVADASPEKQGKYLPGSRIPVVAPASLAGARPTDVLILPWNIAPEIVPIVSRLVPGARSWTAVPQMRTASE